MTFAGSWAIWLGIVLADRAGIVASSTLDPVKDLAAFAPSLVALALVFRNRGRRGVRQLASQALRWRFDLGWYMLGLFGPLAASVAALATHSALGGAVDWPAPSILLVFPLVLVAVMLLFGPLAALFVIAATNRATCTRSGTLPQSPGGDGATSGPRR